jgi:CheY-like chemotaxis protein
VTESRPDVVLLDVMMPVMSRTEMLHALKIDEDYCDIPVIMMSAAGQEVLEAEVVLQTAGSCRSRSPRRSCASP